MHAAMILCAGLGTRLLPLTSWLAKPMLPVGDRAAIEHITAHVRAANVERIVVNVHHRPDDLRAWAKLEHVLVSEEADLLGTAGGVHRANEILGDGDLLVWNGNTLARPDLAALFAAHRHAATLAVVLREPGEGDIGLDADNRIVRMRTESFGEETRGADFSGIHVLGQRLRADLPVRGGVVSDVFLPALRHGHRLDAFVIDAFDDIHALSAYAATNRAWLGDRASWSAENAHVNADVTGSIVGAHARIDAPATNCIVWPHTCVRTPVHDAVVTPHGTVPI